MKNEIAFKLPKTWVILIGNSQYDNDSISNLPNVSSNITLLEEFFKTEPLYNENEETKIRILLNEQSPQIHLEVARICNSLKPDSRIILYYSGHGLYSSSTSKYFLSSRESQDEYVDETSIDPDKLLGHLRRSRAKDKILIVDACYSGNIHGNLANQRNLIYNQFIESSPGMYVVSSTDKDKPAKFDPGNPYSATYFTQYLIDSLKNGIKQDSKFLTLEDIFSEVSDALVSKGYPKPEKTIKGDSEKFIFCSNKYFIEHKKEKRKQTKIKSEDDFKEEKIRLQKEIEHKTIEDEKIRLEKEKIKRELAEKTKLEKEREQKAIKDEKVRLEKERIQTELEEKTKIEKEKGNLTLQVIILVVIALVGGYFIIKLASWSNKTIVTPIVKKTEDVINKNYEIKFSPNDLIINNVVEFSKKDFQNSSSGTLIIYLPNEITIKSFNIYSNNSLPLIKPTNFKKILSFDKDKCSWGLFWNGTDLYGKKVDRGKYNFEIEITNNLGRSNIISGVVEVSYF